LLLAHQSMVADMGPHGVPMSVALDGKNRGKFTVTPMTDLAAEAIESTKARRRKEFPDDPQHGVFYVATLPTASTENL